MRSGHTHDLMTKMLLPNMSMKTIRAVNHAIDNPTRAMMAIQDTLRTAERYPISGLNTYGHRRHNHDWFSSILAGWTAAGPQGALAAYAHMLEDLASDYTGRSFSYYARDLGEAAFNYNAYLMNKNKKAKKKNFY